MASPFRIFRKHQKAMLAVIGILAMIAFVFIGPWSGLGGGGAAPEDPVVFTWEFGNVTQSELDRAVAMPRAVNNFLMLAALETKTPEAEMRARTLRNPTKADVVHSMLLAKKAEQMGITASDAEVNNFLEMWTEGRVPRERLAQLVNRVPVGRNRSLTQHDLFETLRHQFQASYVQQMFQPLLVRSNPAAGVAWFTGDTPAERWDYYCRLNRKVTAELLPVAVADFVAEIPDPTQEELRGFYEQYKNNEPAPESPVPGFRQPFKAQFQYFKADYEQLLAQELPKITEEEVQEFYETHKDRDFRKARLRESSEGPDEQKSEADADEKGADEEASEPEEKKKEPEAKEAETNESDAKGKSEAEEKKQTEADEKESETTPDETAAPSSDQPPASSIQEKSSSDDGKKSPADEQSNLLQHEASLTGELLALADEPAPADATAQPSEKTSPENQDAEPTASQTPDPQTPDASLPPVEYEPLEKVADLIRDRLASQKVDEQIKKAFDAILPQMEKYRSEQSRAKVKLRSEPEPLNFAALAKKYGLEATQTEMITARQTLEDTDIGKSSRPIGPPNFTATPFVRVAFDPELLPYHAEESEDVERNRYLWWKTDSEAAHTPPLAEIEPEVAQAWKLIEARKPALEKAKQYAEEVRQAKRPMREVFAAMPGREVTTAGPFSWLTRPLAEQWPQLSEVSGVQHPGNEFMKAVFALKTGETGVAPNQPQTTYYVVQIESEEPPLAELEDDFLAAMAGRGAMTYAFVGAEEHQAAYPNWLKELENQFDFRLVQGATLEEDGQTR